jgi:hypothetical protein
VISRGQAIASTVGIALLAWATAASHGFVPVLDHANLAFHEAGHWIYGIFGRTMALYGGTLGQLTFPLVALGIFAYRRQPIGVAFAGTWLGENFVNIARYMSDARSQALPLVGGGEHDWTAIFNRWGALMHDKQVARVTSTLGWILMLTSVGWLWWSAVRRAEEHED